MQGTHRLPDIGWSHTHEHHSWTRLFIKVTTIGVWICRPTWLNNKEYCRATEIIRYQYPATWRIFDRLYSTMGFPILVRKYLYIESGPRAFFPSITKTFTIYASTLNGILVGLAGCGSGCGSQLYGLLSHFERLSIVLHGRCPSWQNLKLLNTIYNTMCWYHYIHGIAALLQVIYTLLRFSVTDIGRQFICLITSRRKMKQSV